MTVPPTTDTTPSQTAAFVVPPGFATTMPIGKPNWIQDAEAIAKADITRLEGKLRSLFVTLNISVVISSAALILAVYSLYRVSHT